MLKVELLQLARAHKHRFMTHAVDETARERGVTVVRLQPYHCELNPIELVWVNVKGAVARRNTTFKLPDVKKLFEESVASVGADAWRKCISHVETEEQRMWDLDIRVEVLTEPIIITSNNGSSDSDTLSNSFASNN